MLVRVIHTVTMGFNMRTKAFAISIFIFFASVLSLYALPDLILENLTFFQASPTEGNSVEISVNVKNIGDVDVSQREDVEIRFYDGDPKEPKLDALRIEDSDQLLVGLKRDKVETITIKWRARAGKNEIHAIVDPNNLIKESNESNNLLKASISVSPWNEKVGATRRVAPTDIDAAIKRGITWLKTQQGEFVIRCLIDGFENPTTVTSCMQCRANLEGLPIDKKSDEPWEPTLGPGSTAFVIYTFLTAGLTEDDPSVQKGLDYLLSLDWESWNETYDFAVSIMALMATGNKAKCRDKVEYGVKRLVEAQLSTKKGHDLISDGGWGYGPLADGAHIQYVLFALYLAKNWGLEIPPSTWKKAEGWVSRTQTKSGGWDYNTIGGQWARSPYGSMTATGIMSLRICGVPVEDQRIQRAVKWLERHYTITSNPGAYSWHYYYLVALQRALDLYPPVETLGGHNWYKEAVNYIVAHQEADGRWKGTLLETGDVATTCLAILFLKRPLHRTKTAYLPENLDKLDKAMLLSLKGNIISQSPEKPPIVELEKGVYQVGNVKVDKNKREAKDYEVIVPGEINLIQGMIEFLACAKGGKLHESALLLDVEPLHLQLGLILVGLEHENNLRYQGDPRLSKGDPVEIFVEWERNNKLERHRAEELVFDRQKKAPMPKTHWLFTGSRINNSVFMAQATKNIIATYNDPDSIINQPFPTRSDDTAYSVNTDVLPPKNTKVKLIIKPLK